MNVVESLWKAFCRQRVFTSNWPAYQIAQTSSVGVEEEVYGTVE